MQEKFKLGDTVKLKSGSPLMTINVIRGEYATCSWFISGEQKSGRFHVDALMKASE